METINVNASAPYEVVINGDYSLLPQKLKGVVKGKLMVVYDQNTHRLFAKSISKLLESFLIVETILPAGENTKSEEYYFKLLGLLAKNKFTREDSILAVGGGVVGDLCGFVASTYMRGIGFISCPTTLLSCVDSSVGGKTAINLPEGKNLVGSFYQPNLVYISVDSLKTLPKREIECGMGEIVKYAFLSKTVSAKDLEEGITENLIYKCIQIKKEIVEKDEFDKGERAKLNLGHTVGHAVESLSGYKHSHGLCVAKGIGKIIDISCKYYGYEDDKKQEFINLLNTVPFDLNIDYSTIEIQNKILIDKKACNDGVNLILIKDVGKTVIVKFTQLELENVLK